ncbi:MAG: ATP-dependent RecD-like DNA helicase [Clostridia bacterium]|nr:ATP-dependent RecD-like DNA helicase [Clostridia bacterium]
MPQMEEQLQEPSTVKGTVDRITFQNHQNGYTVAVVRNGKERVTVVGIMPFLSEGDLAQFVGHYMQHPTYGQQLSVTSFERCAPEGTAAILRYLSGGAIRGIGPGTAARIVEQFGADSLDILQNHPEQLATVRGISLSRAYEFSAEYAKQFGVREVMLLLNNYRVSPEMCVRIYRVLGEDSSVLIRENPYILCREEIGFSFDRVEQIAADFEIPADNEMRLCAGVEFILRQNLMNGHTCLPADKLTAVAIRLLESDALRIEQIIDMLIKQLRLQEYTVGDRRFLALPEYFVAEDHIAARLTTMVRRSHDFLPIDDLEIDYVENKLGIRFEALQRQAVRAAFENNILIVTGGPGTGKTTTLNAIIELLERRDAQIALAAPTGRAAKRMTELTGREAKTLHRLLEVNWTNEARPEFSRNEKNPLTCDVIIVDEASMIDSLLFDSLLRALRLNCRLILVGDADQLPSVSAGNILADLLAENRFPSIALNKVFRQAKESLIVTNAHAIIENKPPVLTDRSHDFFFLHRDNMRDVCNTVLELCAERLPKAYGFDPLTDIQVLCPSRKTDAGTVQLNALLQSCLNPPKAGDQTISYKGFSYRVGDKVMQIKNNYEIIWRKADGEEGTGAFNGDVGFIISVDRRANTVTVQFEDRTVNYMGEEIGELEPAYAITVHKSQGSEFDCVIMPLFETPSRLRYRNLLYTGVTRAKKMLVLVGDTSVFYEMAENDRKTLRYTLLRSMLENYFYGE